MVTKNYKGKKAGLILAMMMSVLLVVAQFCVPAYVEALTVVEAENGKNYSVADACYSITQGGDYAFTGSTTDNYIQVTSEERVTIRLKNVNIKTTGGWEHPALDICDGSKVTLILEGKNCLQGGKYEGIGTDKGYAGIHVEPGSEVVIIASDKGGSLEAVGWQGKRGAAGIGGNHGQSCGKITIGIRGESPEYGPTIIAKGGGVDEGDHDDGAAGIGGGYDGQANNGIIINSGHVTATGGNGAAGIGGGQASSAGAGGKAENIQIHGGTVIAKGGNDAPGIGGGESGDTGSGGNIDNIYIAGGTIEATGGNDGAGIGGGAGSAVGTIRIENLPEGASIKATGGAGAAGIGSANEDVELIDISLKGGEIEAIGGKDGAGIGGAKGKAEKINITGHGKIKAKGYDESSAIGSGRDAAGGTINIVGDHYTGPASQKEAASHAASDYALYIDLDNLAKGNGMNDAAAIGGSDSKGGDINIKNAYIRLYSKTETKGAGIGSGRNTSLSSGSMGDITLENCCVSDSGFRLAPTIGAGREGYPESITITNCYIKGSGIGGTSNQSKFFSDPEIKSITISKSVIIADAKTRVGSNRICARAAIGSGSYGAVGAITITGSKVEASTTDGAGIGSGGYYSDDSSGEGGWTGGACGDIIIKDSEVTANGGEGGAGIGGGWGTSVDDITIENSIVSAHGTAAPVKTKDGGEIYRGSAGIGSGWAESCGAITIKNSIVSGTGSEHGAGIGSSGSDGKYAVGWGGAVNGMITIEDSQVTGDGGKGAAGIGTGEGATFGDGAEIIIKGDCKIRAYGGEGGAGIGGGRAGDRNRGGESCPITIDLDSTEYRENPEEAENFVFARGGDGAAGIGSGGARSAVAEPNDAAAITIKGGYVYAQGGKEGSIKGGAGAGIGGGNGGAKLKSLTVDGGIVEAHAGTADTRTAYDIGAGGNDNNRSNHKCKVTIRRGTVWGSIGNDGAQTIVDGGSINQLNEGAKDSKGNQVYRTRMKVHEAGYAPVDYTITSQKNYDVKDVYADKNKRIYLYLLKSQKDEATAEYYSEKHEEYRYYYGTTTTDGEGWLKMDGNLHFKATDEHATNEDFILELEDEDLVGAVKFELKQDSPEEKRIRVVEKNETSPGAWIKLHATGVVTYTVNASIVDVVDSEMYWSGNGTYTETISKERTRIIAVDDPSKVYDGKAVSDPAVTLNTAREGADITYKYFDEEGRYLGNGKKPDNAGSYFVQVLIAADEHFTSAESELQPFEIEKRPITLAMEVSSPSEDLEADLKIYAFNAVNDPGEVDILIEGLSAENYTETLDFVYEDQRWVAKKHFDNLQTDWHYYVTAHYNGTSNYLEAEAYESYYKDSIERAIKVNDLEVAYNGEFITEIAAEFTKGQPHEEDYFLWEVVEEHCDQPEEIGEPDRVVSLGGSDNPCPLQVLNAGTAVVKVTLRNDEYYQDAEVVAYGRITVTKKPLYVTSYAYRGNDPSNKVTEATYGSLGDVKYDLSYDGITEGLYPDDVPILSGSLQLVPLPVDAGVGEHQLTIRKVADPSGNPFYSRNYEIVLQEGTVNVLPATLRLDIHDATSTYGRGEPNYSADIDGLMPWDTEDDILKVIHTKEAYSSYKPGIYEGAITADASKTNYKFEDERGISTISEGTLTLKKGFLDADISVPSFTYTGNPAQYDISVTPIAWEDIQPEEMAPAGTPKIGFYKLTEDGSVSEMSTAPVDVGYYMVQAVFDEDDYYNKETAADYFQIYQAVAAVDTPTVPDLYIKENLKLSDQKLPDGWAWVDGSQLLSVGPVAEQAVYTPENPNYKGKYDTIRFSVLKRQAKISITEDPSKVYDGEPIVNPDVKLVSDTEDFVYEYYDVTNEKNLGTEAPTKAGKYKVKAYVEETEIYTGAASEYMNFVIEKRDTTLKLSAVEDVDGDSAKVKLLVEVLVTDGVSLDEDAEITLEVSEASSGASKTMTAEVKQVEGKNIAQFDFTRAAANHYDVCAMFEETQNFNPSEVKRSFDKTPGGRTLEVKIENEAYMQEDTITVTYGTEPEVMTAIPSILGPQGDPNKDLYTFTIISESKENTLSLVETGRTDQRKLVFENAGTALLEVKVSNPAYYADAVTYVTVVVEKRQAEISSYAYKEGESAGPEPISVQYGQVGTLEYGLQYTDQWGGAGEEILPYIEPVPVHETAGVKEGGWPVKIVKSGEVSGQKSVLRNYALSFNRGIVNVTPAPLVLKADDVSGIYGQEPVFSCTAEGLMDWDKKADVVETVGPAAGSEYADLAPGTYDISIVAKDNPNYSMSIIPAVLTIGKGTVNIQITEKSKVYDGKPAIQEAVAEPVTVNVDKDKLEAPADVQLTYYAVDGEGNRTVLSEAPSQAGNYAVTAFVPENEYYMDAGSETEFRISKRDVVLAMSAEENLDGDITKAKITVEVLGTEDVPLDEDAEITLHVSEASGAYSKVSTEKVKLVDGRYIAEFNFTRAVAEHYDAKAEFAETANFNKVEAEQGFEKEPGERTLDISAAHSEYMKDNTITVPYGTMEEIITATPSVEGPSADGVGDIYSFEIVQSALGRAGNAVISLEPGEADNQQKIVFHNAGTAVIKVTVSNRAYYADAAAYVTVCVEPVALKVTANDVSATYGMPEPEYTYMVTGLAPGDRADDFIFEIGLAKGLQYAALTPGVYEDAIVVDVGENPNYIITVEAGDLTINGQIPDTPDNPDTPDTPNTPDEPENPDAPSDPVIPDNPENPSMPDTPVEPDDPVNPDTPDGPNNPNEEEPLDEDVEQSEPDKDGSEGVQTGDETHIIFWMLMLLTAGVLCIALGKLKKRNV